MRTSVGRAWARLRPYATDAGVALAVLAVTYVPLLIPRPNQPGPYPVEVWLLLAGTALPLVVRRRFPIGCLIAIYASLAGYNTLDYGVSQPVSWGMLVAIYSIAWVGRRWHQALVMLLLTVAGVLGAKSPTTATIGLLTGAFALVLGTLARRRELRVQQLAYRAGQLERDQQAQAERAVAAERERIARDMHDVLAHAVSLMVVQAEAGPVVVRTAPDRAERAFEAIATAGRDAMVQLRRALGLLKQDQDTGVRQPQPTVAAIPALVEQVREAGLAASLTVDGGVARALSPDTEVAAYRIVQEALTNTLKHAAASTVTVTLDWGDELVITVRDDGSDSSSSARRAAPVGGTGSGLIGIRERAAACGGHAEAYGDSRGFTVTATLPAVAR